jgi:hypothetical protein
LEKIAMAKYDVILFQLWRSINGWKPYVEMGREKVKKKDGTRA